MLFLVIAATGTVSAVLLLPDSSEWTGTTYGRLLVVKIAVFLLVVVLAVVGRRRLGRDRPVPATAGVAGTAVRRPLGRLAAAVESAALATVVLAAAAVTTVTPARLVPVSMLDAMGARATIDTVETVTSGFGTVVPNRSRRTGKELLEGQPWAEGGAADATVAEDEGRRTLLFALPALGYHFALRLDETDRIVAERTVTPNHLRTREYRYP